MHLQSFRCYVLNSIGGKWRNFSMKITKMPPLRKQKLYFFSQYPLRYGRKWLIWSYNFGLMIIKCISHHSGRKFEFHGWKMEKFQHKITKINPWENKNATFSPDTLLCMAGNDLWSYKFGLLKRKCNSNHSGVMFRKWRNFSMEITKMSPLENNKVARLSEARRVTIQKKSKNIYIILWLSSSTEGQNSTDKRIWQRLLASKMSLFSRYPLLYG